MIACLGVILLGPTAAAQAAYPGSNGKLAFARDGQIWTMNADGTGEVQLTNDAAPAGEPEWSPDGTRILYTRGVGRGREVRVINADGTGDGPVHGPSPDADAVYSPTWSPRGDQVAFMVAGCPGYRCTLYLYSIFIAYPDGSDPRRRKTAGGNFLFATDVEWSPRGSHMAYSGTVNGGYDTSVLLWPVDGSDSQSLGTYDPNQIQYAPAWSPDGAQVGVLYDTDPPSSPEITTVQADGTNRRQLTDNNVQEYGLDWSPDGEKIVYSGQEPGCDSDCNPELHVMNADGTERVRLTSTAAAETEPDWQPLVDPPGPVTYPHPQAARKMHLSLVPAYESCMAPNRTHGPPLTFGSCHPPIPESPKLTVGTPGANGAPARMVGSATLRVIGDHPPTAVDEADVGLSINITDVRCRPGVRECLSNRPDVDGYDTSGGGDYWGDLTVRLPLQFTDRYNLPAPGGDDPGTGDRLQQLYFSCSATESKAIGSTCSTTTSLNGWYPGAIRTGRQAIFELGQVEVLDGTEVNGNVPAPFLRSGVFIP